jgi:hypothetical protein
VTLSYWILVQLAGFITFIEWLMASGLMSCLMNFNDKNEAIGTLCHFLNWCDRASELCGYPK